MKAAFISLVGVVIVLTTVLIMFVCRNGDVPGAPIENSTTNGQPAETQSSSTRRKVMLVRQLPGKVSVKFQFGFEPGKKWVEKQMGDEYAGEVILGLEIDESTTVVLHEKKDMTFLEKLIEGQRKILWRSDKHSAIYETTLLSVDLNNDEKEEILFIYSVNYAGGKFTHYDTWLRYFPSGEAANQAVIKLGGADFCSQLNEERGCLEYFTASEVPGKPRTPAIKVPATVLLYPATETGGYLYIWSRYMESREEPIEVDNYFHTVREELRYWEVIEDGKLSDMGPFENEEARKFLFTLLESGLPKITIPIPAD